MKTILLHIHRDDQQEARLQVALDVARACDGHVSCVHVTPFEYFVAGDPFGGTYVISDILGTLREQENSERERIEARLVREGVSWDWQQFDGNVVQTLLSTGRLADVIVVSQYAPGGEGERPPLKLAGELAIHAQSPVLVVPPRARGIDCAGHAMVAWNGSQEAAHALRLALPLLKLAGDVHLVEVSDDDRAFPATDAATYLSRHGIEPELHEWVRKGRSTGAVLAEAADQIDAAYIVMGAYGHSRLRETVMGGVTRELIANSIRPLLMAH